MIQTQHVTVAYNGGPPALNEVSVTIEKGEFVFLVGQTGQGKSTFFRLLNRELTPTQGRVLVAGRDVTNLPNREVPFLRRQVGVVHQDLQLLRDRTVRENLAFALHAIGAPRVRIIKDVPHVLELVGLIMKANSYPNDLSGGEQQRVAIARALVNNPPILLADEPTGNLDPETSRGIAQLLHQINLRGTTVVVATHDPTIVDALKKRVLTISRGRIVRDLPSATYEEAVGDDADALGPRSTAVQFIKPLDEFADESIFGEVTFESDEGLAL